MFHMLLNNRHLINHLHHLTLYLVYSYKIMVKILYYLHELDNINLLLKVSILKMNILLKLNFIESRILRDMF